MSTPKVIDGKLDLSSVQALSPEELETWIDRRLRGQDISVPGDARQGDMPYALLATIYPKLDKHTRRDIDTILIQFVRDMARNTETHWTDDAAHNLLLLAQEVCGNEIRDYVLEMAEHPIAANLKPSDDGPDVHARVLQSLLAINWRGTEEFWMKQLALAPERYSGIVFNGLTLISLELAICMLTRVQWTDELQDQLYIALPELLELQRPDKVGRLMQQYLSDMPQDTQQALQEMLEEEQVPGFVQINKDYDLLLVKRTFLSNGYSDVDLKESFTWGLENAPQRAA